MEILADYVKQFRPKPLAKQSKKGADGPDLGPSESYSLRLVKPISWDAFP